MYNRKKFVCLFSMGGKTDLYQIWYVYLLDLEQGFDMKDLFLLGKDNFLPVGITNSQ